MISSELPEVIGMCDRILVMRDGGLVAELPAGLRRRQAILARRATRRGRAPDAMPRNAATRARRTPRGRRRAHEAVVRVDEAAPHRRSPSLIVVIIVGAILVATVGRNFFSAGNIRDILTGMSVLGLVAIGQTLVILCASLDLSVPYVISLVEPDRAPTTMDGNAGEHPGAVPSPCSSCAAHRPRQRPDRHRAQGQRLHRDARHRASSSRATSTRTTRERAAAVPWEFQLIGATGVGPVPVSTIIMLAARRCSSGFFLARTRTGNHMFAVGGNEQVAAPLGHPHRAAR